MALKIYHDREFQSLVNDDWLFLDTNVLSQASVEEGFYKKLLELFPRSSFIIDPIVRVEFLRGSFLPGELEAKSEFLSLPSFCPSIDRPDQKVNAYTNAIALSRVLSHKGYKHTKLGDLLLMGKVMLYSSTCILTGDFADFPLCLFDRLNLISIEKEDGQLVHYQLVKFSREKYESCIRSLPNAKY